MNTTCIDLLSCGWSANLELAERLLATIADERITTQPAGVVNHPAWTLAHLVHYHPAILALVDGRTVPDPASHPDADRFDAGSTPVDDPSQYPTKAALIRRYRHGHQRIETALGQAPTDRLNQPPGLTRWTEGFGTTARVLQYLMVFHEAEHLGQLVAWRRAMRLGPLGD